MSKEDRDSRLEYRSLSFWATKEMLDDWKSMDLMPKNKTEINKATNKCLGN